jgi:hypothetical protein
LAADQSGFNMGRSVEITREEVKFYKFIDRLRHHFSKMFLDFLRVQLLLKGIMTEEDWTALKQDIKIVYNSDNYFWDLKEAEIMAERIKMLSYIEPYKDKYFSTDFIRRKILHQTEEEIRLIDLQIKEDKQKLQQEQMAQMAQQQLMQQQGIAPASEQGPEQPQ